MFCKFPSSQEATGNEWQQHAHKCWYTGLSQVSCTRAALSRRLGCQRRVYETGTYEQRPKVLAGVDYTDIRQSTFKEKEKQMHQAGNPSAEERICGQLYKFLSLLNFPFQATYLGHRTDHWAHLRMCAKDTHCSCKILAEEGQIWEVQ